ncbi:MAG: hypothetical protein QM500_19735 [Methylococcales bacterium]
MNIKKIVSRKLLLILMLVLFNEQVLAHGPIITETPAIDISTFPPVEQDIQTLANYGNAARIAGQHLVERGYNVLNELHAALLNPNASFPQKMQLITVLGEIGEAGSVEHILDVANASPNSRYLYQNSLLALAKFEQTEQITEFVDKQLTPKKGDPLIQRSALAYYAQQPAPQAAQWVKQYTVPNVYPNVRYAALYLGAKLGMESVKAGIIELLTSGQKIAREYYLLIGLAEVTTLKEFMQIIESFKLNANNKNKAIKYAELIKGTKKQREQRAKELLNKGDITQKKEALDYLIENKDVETLANNWQQGDGLVRGALKRLGLEIKVTDGSTELSEIEHEHEQPQFWMIGFVLAGLLIAVIIWQQRRMHKNA